MATKLNRKKVIARLHERIAELQAEGAKKAAERASAHEKAKAQFARACGSVTESVTVSQLQRVRDALYAHDRTSRDEQLYVVNQRNINIEYLKSEIRLLELSDEDTVSIPAHSNLAPWL